MAIAMIGWLTACKRGLHCPAFVERATASPFPRALSTDHNNSCSLSTPVFSSLPRPSPRMATKAKTAILNAEDEYGRKWDRYLSNSLIKMGTGLLVGGTFSLFLFRRRLWPIHFGLGAGFGFASSDFQKDLNSK